MTKILFLLLIVGLLNRVSSTQQSQPCLANIPELGSCICNSTMGMVSLNGMCVCDYGYLYYRHSCFKCGANNTQNGVSCSNPASCQPGYISNGKTCRMNWNVDNCPTNRQYWNGSSCQQRTSTIGCQQGFAFEGGVCRFIFRYGCPKGRYYNGRGCALFTNPPVCLEGYSWDNLAEACIYMTPDFCQNTTLYWNGARCALKSKGISCRPGMYWNGRSCAVASAGISCVEGYRWATRSCVHIYSQRQTTLQIPRSSGAIAIGRSRFAQTGSTSALRGVALSGQILRSSPQIYKSTQNNYQVLNRTSNQFVGGAGRAGAGIAIVPQTDATNGLVAVSKGIQPQTPGGIGIANNYGGSALGIGGAASGSGAVGGVGIGVAGKSGAAFSSRQSNNFGQFNRQGIFNSGGGF